MAWSARGYLFGAGSSKKFLEIRVGSQFQAEVPTLANNNADNFGEFEGAKLLWNPLALPEDEVDDYLDSVKALRWKGLNEEKVLFLLHQCDYNKKEALKRYQLLPDVSSPPAAWSEEECQLFEDALDKFGKNFGSIQRMVLTKSVSDITEFYYVWKKTERHDVFIRKVSWFRRSRFKRNARKKMFRTMEYADEILEEELSKLREH